MLCCSGEEGDDGDDGEDGEDDGDDDDTEDDDEPHPSCREAAEAGLGENNCSCKRHHHFSFTKI